MSPKDLSKNATPWRLANALLIPTLQLGNPASGWNRGHWSRGDSVQCVLTSRSGGRSSYYRS
jgi:hypothetical protein